MLVVFYLCLLVCYYFIVEMRETKLIVQVAGQINSKGTDCTI